MSEGGVIGRLDRVCDVVRPARGSAVGKLLNRAAEEAADAELEVHRLYERAVAGDWAGARRSLVAVGRLLAGKAGAEACRGLARCRKA